jgi:hypothetical protein
VVIPVIYLMVDGGKQWAARRFGGFLDEGTPPGETAATTPEVAPSH